MQPNNRPVIAITGLEGRDNPYPGCAVAKALRAARGNSVKLVGLSYDPALTGAQRNDLFDQVFVTPLPSDPPSAILRSLSELRAKCGVEAVIPTLDSEIPLWSRLQAELLQMGLVTMLPPHSSVLARTKARLPGFCKQHGFLAPETEPISDVHKHFARPDWSFPAWLKGPLADAERVNSMEEADAVYARLAATWGFPVLAQKPLHGVEYDMCAVARNGSIDAAVTIRKVALSSLGKAVAAVVVEDEGVARLAEKIVRALNWHGPLELEMMRAEDTGEFHLIEINARFPAWVGMTPGTGLNLPERVLATLLGETIAPAPIARAGTLFVRTSRSTVRPIEVLGNLLASGTDS